MKGTSPMMLLRSLKNIYWSIKDYFAFKKKLKEMRKRDPYIYK